MYVESRYRRHRVLCHIQIEGNDLGWKFRDPRRYLGRDLSPLEYDEYWLLVYQIE